MYPVLILGLVLTGRDGVAPALMTHTSVANYPEERRSVGSAINSMAVRIRLAFGSPATEQCWRSGIRPDRLRAGRLSAAGPRGCRESLGVQRGRPQTSPVWLTPRAMRTCPVSNWCWWSRRWCWYCCSVVVAGLPAHLDVGENKTVEVAS